MYYYRTVCTLHCVVCTTERERAENRNSVNKGNDDVKKKTGLQEVKKGDRFVINLNNYHKKEKVSEAILQDII